jgi:hypothetical protein
LRGVEVVQKLSSAVQTEEKVALNRDDMVWAIQSETEIRMASAMSRGLSKLGVGA